MSALRSEVCVLITVLKSWHFLSIKEGRGYSVWESTDVGDQRKSTI